MTADVMQSICCGVVSGLKFCTSGRTTCSTAKHVKKVAVVQDALYVAGPRNCAFQQISVSSTRIPTESLKTLLGEKYTLDTWQRLFATIVQSEEGLDDDEFGSLKRRTLTSSIGVTPRKKIERYEEGSEAWDSLQASKVSPIGSLLAEVQDVDTEVLATQLDKMLTLTKDNVTRLDKLRREVGNDIDRLEVAVQEIARKAGTDPGIGDAPMLSPWEGISFVNNTVQEALQASGNLHNEVATARRRMEELESKVESESQSQSNGESLRPS